MMVDVFSQTFIRLCSLDDERFIFTDGDTGKCGVLIQFARSR